MKNNLILIALVCLSITTATAQNKVRVLVKDSVLRAPVELTNVSLLKLGSAETVGGITNAEGSVLLDKVKAGTYTLLASYLGFNDFSKIIEIKSDTSITLSLVPSAKLLNEIIVTGQRAILENKPDRMVYNVDQKTQKGNRIADAMRNIPFVVVTNDNLTINGKNNYKILKDGNPSTLSVLDLKSLPANLVQSIEIITAPSSKYEGEYESIINIITRREENYRGGSSLVRFGTRSSVYNLSYINTNDRFNTTASVTLLYDRLRMGSDINRTLFSDTLYRINQRERSLRTNPGLSFKYGTEITLSKIQFLGVGASVGYANSAVRASYASMVTPGYTDFSTLNHSGTKPLDANVYANYSLKIGKLSKLYFSNIYNFNDSRYSLRSDGTLNDFVNKNENSSSEYSSQLDFETSPAKGVKLETGLKLLARHYQLSATYAESTNENQDYHQVILGGYVSASKTIKKAFLRIGVRLENTDNKSNGISTANFNVLPNALFSYKLKESNGLRFSYRRYLQRPGFTLLSNFINRNTPLALTYGNPDLVNETFDKLELENYYNFERSDVSFSFFYTNGNNLVSSNRIIEGPITKTTYGNLSRSEAYGAYVSFNRVLLDGKVRFFSSANLSRYAIRSAVQSNDGLLKSISGGFNINAVPKLSIDLNASYLSNAIYLQGVGGNTVFMDFSFRYQHKSSSFLLQVNNPIIGKINEKISGNGPGFAYTGNRYYIGRAVGVGYFMSFGKSKQVAKNTREVRINDIKSDEKM